MNNIGTADSRRYTPIGQVGAYSIRPWGAGNGGQGHTTECSPWSILRMVMNKRRLALPTGLAALDCSRPGWRGVAAFIAGGEVV